MRASASLDFEKNRSVNIGKMGASQQPQSAFSFSLFQVYRRAATLSSVSIELEGESEARRGRNSRTKLRWLAASLSLSAVEGKT